MKETGIGAGSVCMGDVTAGVEGLQSAMQGCDAVVLCTSAIPQLLPLSILPVDAPNKMRALNPSPLARSDSVPSRTAPCPSRSCGLN